MLTPPQADAAARALVVGQITLCVGGGALSVFGLLTLAAASFMAAAAMVMWVVALVIWLVWS